MATVYFARGCVDGKNRKYSGFTMYLWLYDSSGSQVGNTITCSEIGSTGVYYGAINLSTQASGGSAVSDGYYVAWIETKTKYGSGNQSGGYVIHMIVKNENVVAVDSHTKTVSILADTNELQTDDVPGLIGALNDVSSAEVNAACDTALSDYDAIVPADLPSNFADLSIEASTGRVDVASIEGSDATDQINAACDASIETYKLDHLVHTADSDDPVNNSIIAKLAASDGDWSGFSSASDSLEAIRDNQSGSGGADIYTLEIAVNSTGTTDYITLLPKKNGQKVTATALTGTIYERVAGDPGAQTSKQSISLSNQNDGGAFDTALSFEPEAGKNYSIDATVTISGSGYNVGATFTAFSAS